MLRAHALSGTKRTFDLFASLILILALMTAAYQLVVTKWVDSLYVVLTITFLGSILGVALGYSRFKNILLLLFTALYGFFIITWQLAFSVRGGVPWISRLEQVGSTVNLAIIHLVESEPVDSPIFFLTLMSILFWVLSVYAGYSLVRKRNPWLTILPMGIVTLLIYIYGSEASLNAGYLATYLFLALILVSRIFIVGRESHWTQSHVKVPNLVRFDFMRVTFFVTFLLVLIAWQLPILVKSFPSFQEAWVKISRSWEAVDVYFENAFAALKPSAQLVGGYYDDSHNLGRGNSRSDDLFLVVNAPSRPSSGVRYYWRARSYDVYTDGIWHDSQTETIVSPPDDADLNVPGFTGRWRADIEITTKELISTLYLPVETIWVSRPNKIVAAYTPDGSLDIFAIHADPQLKAGSSYQLLSALANFTIEELRQAGTDYPSWITDRYLQLPDTVSSRVIELAEFITKGQDNPHDKAAAITIWLRENIEYSPTVPPAPEAQDLVDWLLFDLRRGFCNYYASAEVILLRAAGIPSRISFGYAQGEKVNEPVNGLDKANEGREYYQVLEKDAHSWPEVYFPGYGWVEFEPTVSQAPLTRPINREVVHASGMIEPEDASIGDPEFEENFNKRALLLEREFERLRSQSVDENLVSTHIIDLPWQILIFIAVFISFLVLWRVRKRRNIPPAAVLMETGIQRLGLSTPAFIKRWARQASLQPLDRAFHEINLALKRVGHPALPADTPMERGVKLTRFIPEAAVPVQNLVIEYQASVYSPNPGNWVLVMPNMRLIRKLSYLALLRRMLPKKLQ